MEREREREGNAAAAGAGAGHWEAPNGVIVLPAGSAAPRQPQHLRQQQDHQYQQRQREMEREREKKQQQQDPAPAGVLAAGPDFTQPPEKVYYKTRLCEKFESGKCAYEGGCTFAHGFEELRPPLPVPTSLIRRKSPLPPPSPPPASGAAADSHYSNYYLRVCFEFRDTGSCHRGDRCAFAHTSAAEMPFPGGPRSVEHALRHGSTYARAAYTPGSAAAAHRSSSTTSSYAPATTRAFFPSVPAAGAAGGEGRRRKVTRLELLSRKKMSGIYGDWPEQD